MILDLHRQGLSVTAIARRTGRDPKTIRKYIERGLDLPAYGPRQVGRPNKIAPFVDYLRGPGQDVVRRRGCVGLADGERLWPRYRERLLRANTGIGR